MTEHDPNDPTTWDLSQAVIDSTGENKMAGMLACIEAARRYGAGEFTFGFDKGEGIEATDEEASDPAADVRFWARAEFTAARFTGRRSLIKGREWTLTGECWSGPTSGIPRYEAMMRAAIQIIEGCGGHIAISYV